MSWAASPLGATIDALGAASPRLPVIAGPPPAHDPEGTWTSVAEYLHPGGYALDASIERIGAFYRVPTRAAVAYFSRWWASRAAHVAVFPLLIDGRTFVPRPDELWLRHAEWIDGVAVAAPRAVVPAGDPAARRSAAADAAELVEVVGCDRDVRQRAMAWLMEMAAPVVEALSRRATIAGRQHWAAVADGVAEACVLAGEVTGRREEAWSTCEDLMDLASPPLGLRPRRYVLHHDGVVEASVVKAQCDLAYLDGHVPRHFCLPCPIVKDAERRLRMIDERLHPLDPQA